MAKIFVEPSQVFESYIRIIDKDDLHHLEKVLRIKEGDTLDISDSNKWEYRCEVRFIGKDYIEAEILDKQSFAREPELLVSLFQSVPKATKMEGIIQKCVELGVHEIVPVFTKRTIVTDNGNFSKKLERWQKIANEAVKQCKRGKIPQIKENIDFKKMLDILVHYELIVFPYENEEDYSIKDLLRNIEKKPKSVAIIIGPEGGFSENEANSIASLGARPVTLGRTILRTETAGPAALAMTMYELEL